MLPSSDGAFHYLNILKRLLPSLFPCIRNQRHKTGALDGTAEQALVLGTHASTLTGDNLKLASGKLLE